ncbi:diguanylate cyclase domain-containing protein [Oceanicoccus sp. KOV_DT_Chl]|uniref:sensor domain-containing diguanylate cyclase n=1 Tax=Oceanicoccus sp. KOV_DT_Chl TaxID=1904639 RepID=UPI000C7A7996|nr:diguanylate cyclase [Oceanicoccus sp. KOV_DT_Chl]
MGIRFDKVTVLIFLVSVSATFYTAHYLYKKELSNALQLFHSDVEKYASFIKVESERSLTLLMTLKNLLEVSTIRRNGFDSLAEEALDNYPQLQGVAWVPLVAHADRARYEASKQETVPGFEFKEQNGEQLVTAGVKDFYLPVMYQLSRSKDTSSVGLDLSYGRFKTALEELGPENYLVDMLPDYSKELKKDEEAEYYLTVFMPIYQKNEIGAQNFTGLLIGGISIQPLLANFLSDERHRHIDLVVADMTTDKRTFILNLSDDFDESELLSEYEYVTEMQLAGDRRWVVMAEPTNQYMALVISNSWQSAIAIGLIINFLLPAYIYNLRTRNATVQRLVKEQTARLETANEKLEKLSRTDSLTLLANRRHFDDTLKAEWFRAMRDKKPLSLILCDVDFFKKYNDYYGHADGDVCLQQVALSFRSCFTRSGDVVARFGGEEFAAILPATVLVDETLIARCNQVINELALEHKGSEICSHVTVSLGGCTMIPSENLTIGQMIRTADKALYQAKAQGRNQGVVYDFDPDHVKQGVFQPVTR